MLVVEIGGDPAVGFAGRLLSRFGARVVKVELLPDGDESRRKPPFFDAGDGSDEAGLLFHYLNEGKESVAVDVMRPDAAEIIRALAQKADAVLVDGSIWNNDELLRFVGELDASVLTVITPFGIDGPYADTVGTSGTVFAMGGEASMLPGGLGYQMYPDSPPLLVRGNVVDHDAGVIATAVTLAGMISRANGADPVELDVAKLEAESSLNRWLVSCYHATDWVESRATRAYAYAGLMECKDGWVMLQPVTDRHWQSLVRMIGSPEWTQNPLFEHRPGREEHGGLIQEELVKWISQKTKDELLHLGLEHGVPTAPFWNMAEIAENPHFRERRFYAPYGEEAAPAGELLALPFQAHPDTESSTAFAPGLGADSIAVLTEVLGLTADRVSELVESGTVRAGA